MYKIENEFKFNCQMTACCCQNMEIFLNPYDILMLSSELKLSTTEIVNKYILFLEEKGTGLFRPILKNARKGLCIFNVDNLCIIHLNRPLSCRLFPLARLNGEYYIQNVKFCKGLKENSYIKLMDYLKVDSGLEYLEMADLYHTKYNELKNLNNGLLHNKDYNNLLNILLYDIDYFYGEDLFKFNSKEKLLLSLYLVDRLIEFYENRNEITKEVLIENLYKKGDNFIVKNFNK
ncbi:MAG: YkgJ family cysteine cluster protein [Firmicutes bacterium]|nr:YkgJ family cysteine cluster protein [Bacillota bacterium]